MSKSSYILVIFGITGNLAQIKLIPALYDLASHGDLPEDFTLLGLGRAPMDQQEFKSYFRSVLDQPNRHHQHPIDPQIVNQLTKGLHYLSADVENPDSFAAVKEFIGRRPDCPNRIFYLATYPLLYPRIFNQLQTYGLNDQTCGWVRVVIEKPMGNSLSTAHDLNLLLAKYYSENQIFRLDHYLGKETLQNLLSFRFGNGLFEPLMTREFIDNIQITVAEDFGIGKRGSYFDPTGDLIDMGQNHLLQMLAAATMDPPLEFSNAAVTARRIELIRRLVPDPDQIVFGQYEGYSSEPHVLPGSQTETFFALKASLRHPRFKNIPVYLRSGKYLAQTISEISVVFKNRTPRIFSHLEHGLDPNVLIYRIQPNEGIVVRFLSKIPGPDFHLQESYMQYCYRSSGGELPDPYEKLLSDAFCGDQTFFNDAAEVEAQWRFIDPLVAAKNTHPVHIYPRGSWGPPEAMELGPWLEPSTAFCTL